MPCDAAGNFQRPATPFMQLSKASPSAGWNELRVKVDNTGGPWGFYLEARDAVTDKPLAGLDYRSAPPESKKR